MSVTVISPPSAPTLARLMQSRVTDIGAGGAYVTNTVRRYVGLTIQDNVLHFVAQGGIGAQIETLTDEQLKAYENASTEPLDFTALNEALKNQ